MARATFVAGAPHHEPTMLPLFAVQLNVQRLPESAERQALLAEQYQLTVVVGVGKNGR